MTSTLLASRMYLIVAGAALMLKALCSLMGGKNHGRKSPYSRLRWTEDLLGGEGAARFQSQLNGERVGEWRLSHKAWLS